MEAGAYFSFLLTRPSKLLPAGGIPTLLRKEMESKNGHFSYTVWFHLCCVVLLRTAFIRQFVRAQVSPPTPDLSRTARN